MSSYNLPPGCTNADIDRHFGSDSDEDAPYYVDVPGDLYFSPVGHITFASAKRHAREVGGVVLDDTKAERVVIYGPCSDCGDGSDRLLNGRCPECTREAVNAAEIPEQAWVNDARAWLRNLDLPSGLPMVGAALPSREERLAKIRADLREYFGMPKEAPPSEVSGRLLQEIFNGNIDPDEALKGRS